MTSKLSLVFAGERKTDLPFPLREGPQTIGRSQECDIKLGNQSVSRVHAIIRVSGSRVLVSDAGSRNGTHINGQKRQDCCEVRIGDRIAFGNIECRLIDLNSYEPHGHDGSESTIGQHSDRLADLPRKLLTDAQYIVFEKLRGSQTEQEIADELGNSFHTVHNHVRKIYATLGVKKRADLILKYGAR
jgi:DNA-binding CsgD family transcriptional regulator